MSAKHCFHFFKFLFLFYASAIPVLPFFELAFRRFQIGFHHFSFVISAIDKGAQSFIACCFFLGIVFHKGHHPLTQNGNLGLLSFQIIMVLRDFVKLCMFKIDQLLIVLHIGQDSQAFTDLKVNLNRQLFFNIICYCVSRNMRIQKLINFGLQHHNLLFNCTQVPHRSLLLIHFIHLLYIIFIGFLS